MVRASFTLIGRALLLALVLSAFAASGQTNYTIIKSFGFLEQAGFSPDVLIEGSDGALYGSATFTGGIDWTASPDNPTRGLIFKMQRDGTTYTILHQFAEKDQLTSALIEGTNGVLYGTTASGGTSNRGTVFKLNKDGTAYTVLHDFLGKSGGDGDTPRGLAEGTDGALYGTTFVGGTSTNCPNGCGTAFKLDSDGNNFVILRSFSGASGDGKYPLAGMIEASDGALYGTTQLGGTTRNGTIYKLNKNGSAYAVTANFLGANGSSPRAQLLEGSDGTLYGTTESGGSFNLGTAFKVNKDGTGLQVLHHFTGAQGEGNGPAAQLAEGIDGALYGITPRSGYYCGTVFKIARDGTGYQILHTCVYAHQLLIASDGFLYGTSYDDIFKLTNDGTGHGTIRRFAMGGGDGESPVHVIEGSDGALYGTATAGGSAGQGAVFRLNKDGSGYALLHQSTNQHEFPTCVIEASDHWLYGLARAGGDFGSGAIFKLQKDGSGYSLVFSFNGTNGAGPQAVLLEASDGAFYGTTSFGGTASRGTIFKVNKDGTAYAILHNFTGNGYDKDGAYPEAGLIEGSDGWLYGVSDWGGTQDHGMIFKLQKDGSGYSEICGFPGIGDHVNSGGPHACVVEGPDGMLYGVTLTGGPSNGGVIFKVGKDGSGFARLFDMPTRGYFDGQSVLLASDGVLYGLTYTSGTRNQGSLFRLNRGGTGFAVLHNFTNIGGDGGGPWGLLMEGSDGALYGTTTWGGNLNVGTLFRFVPPPEILSLRQELTGQIHITARALSGTTLIIEASTDLGTWTQLGSGTVVNGHFETDDPEASQLSQRFYRAHIDQ